MLVQLSAKSFVLPSTPEEVGTGTLRMTLQKDIASPDNYRDWAI